jgi:hypothetical protein
LEAWVELHGQAVWRIYIYIYIYIFWIDRIEAMFGRVR